MVDYIIRIKDVWKIYKLGEVEIPALRGLNLDVKRKEFIAIMGKSGSGKSTALHQIGCLDFPTKGKVYLDNIDITTLSESALAQVRGKKIGFVFQQFNLIPSLTALQNVMLPMVFQGIQKFKREKKALDLLELMELQHRINHTPSKMSGGEQQRVAIARSLTNDPEVILADEPTGNLDLKTGESVMELLCKLHEKEHKTIIVVTHDEDIAAHAQRVCYLEDGRIIRCFGAGEIKDFEKFVGKINNK